MNTGYNKADTKPWATALAQHCAAHPCANQNDDFRAGWNAFAARHRIASTRPDSALVTLADAFEMGYSWQQSLMGQTLEDSRAVGRTLYSDTFAAIHDKIRPIIDRDGFDSFQNADIGICAAKRIIIEALHQPAPRADDALREARTALFNLAVSHNTFTTVLDAGIDAHGQYIGKHQLRAPLGKAAVQFALESENEAARVVAKIDIALASEEPTDAAKGD